MTIAVDTTTWPATFRTRLGRACAAGLAAAVIAAGWAATAAPEVARPRVTQVHLETTLAASVTAAIADPSRSNSVAAQATPVSGAAATADGTLNLGQALVFTAAAALLTPLWYVGFPVTIPLTGAVLFLLLRPFVAAEGGTVGAGLAATALAFGTIGWAILPPAAILGGLVNIGQGLFPKANSSQPAAATKARRGTVSTAPRATDHSRRGAPPHTQPTNAVPRRPAPVTGAVPVRRAASPAAGPPSKKSAETAAAKHSAGNSGRPR